MTALPHPARRRGDAVTALPAQTLTGVDRVHHADALTLLRALASDSVDVCFADPPYNNGTKYDGYDDKRDDYKAWCTAWFLECRRVARRVVITPGHGNLWMWGEIEKPFGMGIWYKPGNPSSSVMGFETFEPWLYYCKGNGVLGGTSDIRATVNRQKDVGDHPCPKPLEFMVKLLKKIGKPGQIVFDPFCGTGTTAVAALTVGMRFITCDVSVHYVEIARKRIEKLQYSGIQLELIA